MKDFFETFDRYWAYVVFVVAAANLLQQHYILALWMALAAYWQLEAIRSQKRVDRYYAMLVQAQSTHEKLYETACHLYAELHGRDAR